MVAQLPPATSGLVEPGAPLWAQRMVLRMLRMFVLTAPTTPMMLWQTTQAGLPTAADWTGSQAWLTDLNMVAVSNGVAWTKTDGTAL